MSERDYMKLDMVKKLSALLMEKQPDRSMEQAIAIVLNSDTYQRLQRDSTGLFFQSAVYVFSFLENEFLTKNQSFLQR